MNEERIIQAIEKILDKRIGKVEDRIDGLDNKIDAVSKELKEFKEETNTKVDSIATRLDNFEEETRTNFASMSQMIRNTNERITDLDKKMEKGFENMYNSVGTAMNSMMESIDKNYVKIKNIS